MEKRNIITELCIVRRWKKPFSLDIATHISQNTFLDFYCSELGGRKGEGGTWERRLLYVMWYGMVTMGTRVGGIFSTAKRGESFFGRSWYETIGEVAASVAL